MLTREYILEMMKHKEMERKVDYWVDSHSHITTERVDDSPYKILYRVRYSFEFRYDVTMKSDDFRDTRKEAANAIWSAAYSDITQRLGMLRADIKRGSTREDAASQIDDLLNMMGAQ